MPNEVEIHIKAKDETARTFDGVKAKAKTAGGQAGDEFSGSFKGKLTKGGEDAGRAAGEGVEKGMREGASRGGKATDDEMKRVAGRANKAFDAKLFTGLSLGMPAAAAAGAAGTALALTGISGAFAGLAVAGLSANERVQNSFSTLKSSVVSDVEAMSAPLESTVVDAIDHVGDAWTRLRPQVAAAVSASAPAIDELTGAVTDFAEGAMPGFVTAVKASEPALKGFRSFAGQAGEGLGEFAANASEGSAAAGAAMDTLGRTVATVEGRLGTVFANLSKNSSGPLLSLDTAVDKVTDGLVHLTAQGSGVVGALQGFTTAGSGVLTVLRGVATAAAALPPQVTQFAGAIGASSMLLSKFGVDAGAGFEGLGGKIKAAEGAGGKFKATMSGLAGGVLNPSTAATAGLGIALLAMGQDAERAQRAQATLAASQRTFTDALRASKGAIDDQVRASVAQDLAQKTINGNSKSLLDFARQFGVALPQVTSAVIGETGALDGVNQQLDAYAKANPDAATTVHALKAAIQSKGIAFREGTDAIAAEASATNQSTEAQTRNRDAINSVTEAIYAQQNAQLGYRGAVLNSKQALDEYGKTLKDGKASEDDKAQALLRVEQSFAAQEQAAYQAAYANSTAKDESVRVTEALAAQNREAVNLANSFQGPLPTSLVQAIGKMSATQAQAAGLTMTIDGTGNAVYRLPNGKFIAITSSAGQEAARVQGLIDRINAIPTNKKSTVEIVTIYKQVGTAAVRTGRNSPDVYLYGPHSAAGGLLANAPVRRFAAGGLAGPVDVRAGGMVQGPGTATSDSIMALTSNGPAALSTGEYVEPANRVTPKTLPILEAIRDGRFKGYAAGGMVQAEDGSWVPSSFYGGAPKGPHAMYTDSGFAKLRAAATANGIGSLSAMDQNQLRTYGGWTDSVAAPLPRRRSAVASAAPAVNVTLRIESSGNEFDRFLGEWIRRRVRVEGGGNVQAAFGR